MSKKFVLIIGVAVYSILTVFAIVFYKERVSMLDGAFQFFEIVRKESFAIQANRFGAVGTQIFPVLGIWLGLPLKVVTIMYSLSFVLFPAICFLIILLHFRNARLALCLLLFNTILVAHSFYWLTCELLQGLPFTLVYFSAVERQMIKGTLSVKLLFWSVPALIVITFFYPLLPCVVFFVLAYLWLYYDKKYTKWLLGIIGIYIMIYVIKALFFSSGYDNEAMSRVKNFITLFPDYFSIPSHRIFIKRCIDDYYFILILSAINIVGLLLQKKYQKLLLSLAAFLGFVMLINVSYPDGSYQFYIEPQYAILTVYIAVPFCYDIIPAISKKGIIMAALPVMLLLCLIKIYNTHKEYTTRMSWYQSVLDKTAGRSNKKLIMKAGSDPLHLVKMDWASAYEFWLLSTLKTGNSRSIIIEERPGEFDQYLNENKLFIGKWTSIPYRDFKNKVYFNFTDTSYYQKY